LLRSAIGLVLLSLAGPNLTTNPDLPAEAWILDGLATLAGVLLLAGLMTPIAAVLAGLVAAADWAFLAPPSAVVLQSRLLAALLTGLAVAVVLLGPGAFSFDARLFGLREIIIPRARPEG
jgi:uncharacterized membrane protein YphA (DoxX/SURF4 family)